MADPRATEGLSAPGQEHLLVRQFTLSDVSSGTEAPAFTSSAERTTIGTSDQCDVVVQDPTVSRFHCEIEIGSGRAILRDLGSRNGTRIEGVLVETAYLEKEATLQLGRTCFRFRLGDAESAIALSPREAFGRLQGRSAAMRTVFALLDQVAPTTSTVLLQGETGTGKDLAAESIHSESPRRHGPFVVVDCGAVSPNLIESELFGHEQGAFTGAARTRPGAFEAANGGTLFLDEVGELSLELQPRLLRVLETRKVRRVGGSSEFPVDVRVIAATNRDLRADVNAKRIRSDLYYRLAVIAVKLPPLRERFEDLPLLVGSMLEAFAAANRPGAQRLLESPVLTSLTTHAWPGNVRELRNYIERCLASEGSFDQASLQTIAPFVRTSERMQVARDRCLRSFERLYLEEILKEHGGNVSQAARAAGVDRVQFYRLMRRSGITREG